LIRSRTAPADWIADSDFLLRAHALAARAHDGQRRATDQAPLIEHAVEVGYLLHATGFEERLVAAGLLHDAIERGRLTRDELRDEMDDQVCGLVLALTEDATIDSFEERKEALRDQVRTAGPGVVTIFAADKVSAVRGLASALDRSDESLEARLGTTVEGMTRHYEDCLRTIEIVDPDCPFIPALRAELAPLTMLSPSRPAYPRFREPLRGPGWAPVPD
jgi:(p)ppGpp synthase/HD superfamily hydrolase